jgi:hypothetical protein
VNMRRLLRMTTTASGLACFEIRVDKYVTAARAPRRSECYAKAIGHSDAEMDAERRRRHQPD